MVAPIRPKTEQSLFPWFDLSPATVVRTAWRGRSWVVLVTGVATALGIATALLTPAEFVSEARIMPEMGTGSGEMFKRLASVAGFSGVNLGDNDDTDAVRPDLYPNVLQSTPFVLHLIDQFVPTTDGRRLTVGQLLLPDDKPGWSWKRWLLMAPVESANWSAVGKSGGPVRLSARQNELAEDISRRVSAKLDVRSGVITITARMPDAVGAATVAQVAMDYLTRYVTSYRTEKARQDLQFYTRRLTEARQRYQTAQLAVFRYNDGHKFVILQSATMARQRMEAELTIAQAVYTELAGQLERAKLKVQERTPVFKVLEPAQVPLERVSPKRTIVVLLFATAGLIGSILFLLARRADWAGRLRTLLSDA